MKRSWKFRALVSAAVLALAILAGLATRSLRGPEDAPWLWVAPWYEASLPLSLDLTVRGESRRWYSGGGVERSEVDARGWRVWGEGADFHVSRAIALPAGVIGVVEITTATPTAPIRVGAYLSGRVKPRYEVLAEPMEGRPDVQVARFGVGSWERRDLEGIRLSPQGRELHLRSVRLASEKWPPVTGLDPADIDWRDAFHGDGEIENVLLIVADTLRADHLSLYGYPRPTTPNLERLAAHAVVFESARSQAACTFPSVNSLLTSRPPSEFLRSPIETFARLDGYDTIAKRLKSRGLETFAVSASWVVRATSSRHNDWGGGYSAGFDSFDERCAGQAAECVNHRALATLDAAESPWFLFLHYLDPHDPYSPPSYFPRRFAGRYRGNEDYRRGNPNPIFHAIYRDDVPHGASESDIARLIDLYDDEIRYLDHQLSLLFAALYERDLLASTLIVLAADHGEAFLEHGHIKHCHTVFDFETKTPLIFWTPGVAGGTRSRQVAQNLDIVPTVLEYLGIVGEHTTGRSLRAAIDRDVADGAFAFSEQGSLQSANDGRYKLIRDRVDGSRALFDLARDPTESSDRSSELPEHDKRLSAALGEWTRTTDEQAAEQAERLEERLRALGYLE